MKVGEVYVWSNEVRPDPLTFVVVTEAWHRNSKVDRDGCQGYLGLILTGEHASSSFTPLKRPGETFTFAQTSAIARDSKALV